MLGWFQGERVGRKCKREGERETGKEGGTERRRERKEIKGRIWFQYESKVFGQNTWEMMFPSTKIKMSANGDAFCE